MTRTRRIYNIPPKKGKNFWGDDVDNDFVWQRPVCCGNCPRCKDHRRRARRRQAWKAEERHLVEEYSIYSDFPYDFMDRDCTYDPLADLVDIYYDYLDWQDGTGDYGPDYY